LRAAAETRLAEANEGLERASPGYARFLSPRPVPLLAAQAMLAEDEALIAPLVSDEGLLVWVLRREVAEPILEPIGAGEIVRLVERLRAGLDPSHPGGVVPFDTRAAMALHAALLGRATATGLLSGADHLILVPDGALQRLPPHVLRDAGGAWLIARHAVTVAPSVAAAAAARTPSAADSAAPLGFLGVADPVFDGYARAEAAVLSPQLRRSLAALEPLPETARQVREMAQELGAPGPSRTLLREQATERALHDAAPGQFRVIALASHAVMAGQLPGLAEPAVILTPTRDGPPFEGLLTASDVAAMTLDADLVVLSACNTAAPDGGPYTEGLSGLARAFLQAGARALLVSHWSVEVTETAALLEAFVKALQAHPRPRRAEALQAAMISRAVRGRDSVEPPALWAAFVVVGA
jgi:CHAT domain-containing protein